MIRNPHIRKWHLREGEMLIRNGRDPIQYQSRIRDNAEEICKFQSHENIVFSLSKTKVKSTGREGGKGERRSYPQRKHPRHRQIQKRRIYRRPPSVLFSNSFVSVAKVTTSHCVTGSLPILGRILFSNVEG